jgi:hypothetical protein
VEELRELGARAQKEIPKKLAEDAGLEALSSTGEGPADG